ncbi:uncharacterized protein PHACADRAFT_144819 [Phanerochaete carnosa HHB-10118-sp]|uniref:Uncharacterized protein n=1 Tax=Phanerochaete carnosa (strain HHB-10118-sp) TaxID=650164 RepID=K5V0B8_PHACS|nr:uncharacterized protein PHACADRAFT_144819 [Phanerochaete carnosa HHB-10118-sp]EKM55901.1 hypothetical protein PHACADRAFT_144819 [Phanerochaete carnosa HHB-10118-sp]
MATNDKDNTLIGARGTDVYPGVANPTESSRNDDPLAANFVTDPTTDSFGAGVNSSFTGHEDAARNFKKTAGVVEGRPGIIESSNIDPLNENSNKDDGWANARSTGTGTGIGSTGSDLTSTAASTASSAASTAASAAMTAANMATGAARMAYGHAVGDEKAKQAGKEAVWGKQ